MAAGSGRTGPRRLTVWMGAGVAVVALAVCLVASLWVAVGWRRAAPALDDARPGIVPTMLPSALPPPVQCPRPVGFSAAGVRIGLARNFPPGPVISFGLPVPPGELADAGTLRVPAGCQPVEATVRV